MAWICQRCTKRIFSPREGSYRYAMVWKFIKSRGELTVDFFPLKEIKNEAIVTHVACEMPEIDGFVSRIKSRLGIPKHADHPLLI